GAGGDFAEEDEAEIAVAVAFAGFGFEWSGDDGLEQIGIGIVRTVKRFPGRKSGAVVKKMRDGNLAADGAFVFGAGGDEFGEVPGNGSVEVEFFGGVETHENGGCPDDFGE